MEILFILGSILKVIGYILLGILCVLLLFLLCILCSPIRYQLVGRYQKEMEGTFDITWLFGILHIYGSVSSQEEEEASFCCNLFGRCIFGTGKEEKKKQTKKKKEKKGYTTEETMLSTRSKEEEKAEKQEETVVSAAEGEHRRIELEEIEKEWKEKERVVEEKTTKETVRETMAEEFATEEKAPKKKRESFGKRQQNIKKEGLSKSYFLHMEQKKELIVACVQLMKRVLKGVLPRDFQLKATVGTGDPALTGVLLGGIGVLKMKFGTDVQITGIFTELVAKDVFLQVKGRIVVGYLAYALLRFLITKPVWKTVKVAWKGFR